jgi:hypothetical protein
MSITLLCWEGGGRWGKGGLVDQHLHTLQLTMDSVRSGDEAITINAPLILIVLEVIFYAGITCNLQFRGVFRGGHAFLNPQIVLSAAKGKWE